ncbi:MAG: hypothetical protein AMXMBFR47_13700 [Planctomycetota bacterium]
MAFVYRPITKRANKDGTRTRVRTGFYWASFTDPVTGESIRLVLTLPLDDTLARVVDRTLEPTGEKIRDREVADATLRRLLLSRQRLAAGLSSQSIETARRSLRTLIADYVRHMRRKRTRRGRALSRKHIRQALRTGRAYLELVNPASTRPPAERTGAMPTLADLKARHVERLISRLADAGRSPKTQSEYRSALHSLGAWAVREGLLESNPVAAVGSTGTNAVRNRRALTPDEAAALLEKSGARRTWYEAALFTGLRCGELKSLRWGDVDLDSLTPCIRLRAEATKAGRADSVPLRRSLAESLRAARPAGWKAADLVFNPTPKRETFLRDCRRAGIDTAPQGGMTLDRHSLRKTFITWLSVAGVAPRVAMKLARHTDLRLTMRTYTDDRQLGDAAEVEKLPDLTPRPDADAPIPMRKAAGAESAVWSTAVGLPAGQNRAQAGHFNENRPGGSPGGGAVLSEIAAFSDKTAGPLEVPENRDDRIRTCDLLVPNQAL